MRARLVLLVLVAILSAAVRADGPTRPPDERIRVERETFIPLPPLPVPNGVQADRSGLLIGCDFFSGGPWGSLYEAGWRFFDGSFVKASLSGSPVTPGVTYQRPVWEAENTRCSVVVGTECGVRSEWYLGHAFALQHEFLVPRLQLRACVVWYPVEGVELRFRLDLLRGRRYWGWGLSF